MPTHQPNPLQRRYLGRTADKPFVRKLLAVGAQFGLEKRGYYDPCAGAVNFWCGPDNRPSCWDVPLTRGCYDEPREYVGCISWDDHEQTQQGVYALYVETELFELFKGRGGLGGPGLTHLDYACCLDWCQTEARGLIRLAVLHPEFIGVQCPLCEWVLQIDKPFDGMKKHFAKRHRIKVRQILYGEKTVLQTDQGDYHVELAEKF